MGQKKRFEVEEIQLQNTGSQDSGNLGGQPTQPVGNYQPAQPVSGIGGGGNQPLYPVTAVPRPGSDIVAPLTTPSAIPAVQNQTIPSTTAVESPVPSFRPDIQKPILPLSQIPPAPPPSPPDKAAQNPNQPKPPQNKNRQPKTKRRLKQFSLVVLAILLLGGGFLTWRVMQREPAGEVASTRTGDASQRFDTLNIPLSELAKSGNLVIDSSRSLSINGQLKANNSFILNPSGAPTTPVAGQIYFDQDTNQLSYYNGAQFVDVVGNVGGGIVESIGGATGAIALGSGLSGTSGTLSNTGVLSVQGVVGNVSFTSGDGIAVNGTTLTNTGVLSLGGQTGAIGVGAGLAITDGTLSGTGVNSIASESGNLTVTDDGVGNITLSLSGAGTGTVTSGAGTAGRIAKFTSDQNIEDSLLGESGTVVTVNGDLTVTGALSLSTPLTVASGGTGATDAAGARTSLGAAASGANSDITSLSGLTTALSVVQGGTGVSTIANNGVVIGQGTSAIATVVAGGSGLCFISTAGAPSFQACPSASGITSVNGLTGPALTIANASGLGSTITIDDASTTQKGIAQFNSINFSVASGQVNTIQNIDTSATPTFAGVNTNAINPSGALTVGSTAQNLTLQGANTVITRTSGGNTTTLSFAAPTANVTYRLQTAAAGTYDVCTTAGNCTGVGGSVTTPGGTANQLAKFTASQTIANSIISDDGSLVTIAGDLQVTGSVTLDTPLAITEGGTGAITALAARSNLGAAASGANSDITSLNGLTTALSVVQGGTGATSLTANGVLLGNGTSAISAVAAGSAGQCLVSTAGAPTWTTCPGANGVSSLNGLSGALTLANASGSGSTITIDDASTTQKGIASFNSTNFTVSSGAVNTIQNISTSATPTFAGVNTNSINPSGALTVGATTQNLTLQGASTTITSTSGANTTSFTFAAPTANVTYRLQTAAAGTYDVCTTAGNCVALGGGVTTTGGTTNALAKFTGAQSIGDSIISDNGTTVTVAGDLSVTGALTLGTPLAITEGGTGATDAAGARTSLGAAASGANSDITSLSGLTTALSIVQGGTGATSLTANGVLLGNGTSPISSLVAGSAGQCLVSTAGAPTWTTCPGSSSSVSSLNGLTGALTIANASGSGSTITIDDASTSQKGIAQFNSTNFSAASGIVNTIQDINTTAAPTFGQLTLTSSQASNAMLVINNTNISATGNLVDLQLNGSSRFAVSPAGALTLSSTINGQTISSAANLTGTLAVGGNTTLTGDLALNGGDLTSTGALNITPGGAFTVGAIAQSFTVQGNASSTITATDSSNTTTLSFQTPTADVNYRLLTAAAGTYDICTSVGNCASAGGGVTTAGGTTNTLAKFTGAQTIGDSIITDNGSTVTIGGILSVNTITPTAALTIGATSQNITLQGAITTITSTGAGNDIVLNSADTIELQDNTNITGNLAVTGTTTSSGNINSSGGAIQTGGTTRIDNSGNLTNIGNLTLSGAISGGTTYSGSGNINTTGGSLQTAGTTRVDNTGNLVNIGNITGSGAVTIASSGAGNDITIDGADQFIVQDAANFNGLATFNTDVDLTLADTENLSITSTVTGTNSVNLIGAVLTNNTSSGTQQVALLQNAAGSGTTEGLLVLDNADTDTAVANGIQITSAAGGITTALDVSDADIVTALLFGANDITGTNFTVTGSNGNVSSAGNATLQGGTVTVGTSSQSGVLVLNDGSSNTATLQVASLAQNTTYILPDPGTGTVTICLTTGNCSGSGGGVVGSGTNNRLAKFTATGSTIGDSSISDDGTSVTTTVDVIVQGGDLTVGTTSQLASFILHDGNGQTTTLQAGDSSGNLSFILPTNAGTTNQCLKQSGSGNQLIWDACDGGGGGTSATLQGAYANGNSITTTDARDIDFVLANTTTDSNFDIVVADGSTGFVSLTRANGSGTTDPAQLLLLDNLDADRAVPIGIKLQAAGGGLTTAIDASDADIVDAINVGANNIVGTTGNIDLTNFDVVGTTGNVTAGTFNGQTISSAASLTGTLNVAGAVTLQTTLAVTGNTTLTGDLALNGGDLTSTGALNITPGGALTVGATGQVLTMQGNASTTLTATDSGNTTTIDFTTPTANTTLRLPALAAGTYDICTSNGNCSGAGVTLQAAYNNSTTPELTLDATRGALTVRDNATPLGGNLFEIQNNAGSTTYFAVTASGTSTTGTSTSTGNINSSSGSLQTGGTTRVDNSGNLTNIGNLTLSGAISGGTTYTGSGNINTTGGALQTNSTTRVDNSGNLVNIGNITGTGAITIASTGAGNDIVINGADIFDVQDATTFATTTTFNGTATFNTDVDLTLADTENLSITSTVTGTNSVDLVSGVLTNNSTSGTQRGALLQNAPGTGTTEALLVLDNADTDTSLTTALQVTAAAGGIATAIDLTDADIVDAINVGANNIVGTTGNIDLTNFDVVGSSGNTTVGGTLGVTGTTTLTGNLTANGNATIGNSSTDLVTVTGTLQGANPLAFEGATADASELTLSIASLSADQTITLPDETGTVCLQNSANCGFALSSGSGNYIQNQNSTDQTANFRISGSGQAATSFLAPLFDTAAAGTLAIGSNNATAITLAQNTTVSGSVTAVGVNAGAGLLQGTAGLAVSGAVSSINANSNFATNINTGTSNGTVTIGGGSAALVIDSTGLDVSSAGALSGITTITTSGAINGQTISSAANFTGTAAIAGNTTVGGDVAVNGGDLTSTGALNITPGGALTVGATGQILTLQGNASTKLTATDSGSTTTFDFATPTANTTLRLPALSTGTYDICTSAGNCSGAGTSLQSAYNNSTSPEITLDSTRGALTLRDNATPLGANLFEIQNNAGSTTYFAVTATGTSTTGTTTSTGNINSSGGTIQTNSTNRIDNSGNLVNIGGLTLSGAISGGTTYSGSGNINTTGGVLQTNSTTRVDNSGNLVNIGNVTGTGAITIASTGAGNDIVINGADIFDIQDATTFATTATFNGVATFNTDVDLALADSENLNITSTVTGTTSVDLINGVLTNNTSSGTQRAAVLQNAAGSGTTEALLVLDNADTDTAVTAGLQVTAAAGGITTAIDLTDADIVDAINVGANNIVGTTGNIDLTNFDVVGSSGDTTVGGTLGVTGAATLSSTLGVTGTTTLSGDLAANGNTTIGDANTDTVTITAILQGANPLVFEGGTADANELTLAVASLSADRTITLPDETGTVCLQNSTNCGFALSSGSGNYIQNQNSTDQTADFRISGTGRANTSILTPLVDTAAAGTLALGTTNATAIALNKATTITGALTQSGGAFSLTGSGSTSSLTTTSTALNITGGAFSTWQTSAGGLTIQAAGTSETLTLTTGGSGTIVLGGSNTTTITLGNSNNARTINVGASGSSTAQAVNVGSTGSTSATAIRGGNSSTAITLQTASGGTIGIGNAGVAGTVQIGNTTGAVTQTINVGNNATASSTTNVAIGSTIAGTTTVQGAGGITIGNGSTALTIDSTGLDVTSAGALSGITTITTSGAINGQTISSAANFTGTVAVAGNTTLTGDLAVNGGDITSTGVLNITPGGALTVGATGQILTMQGNASSTITATGGGFTTTVGFTTPTANVALNFPALAAGTYSICTSSGNCSGAGTTLQSAYNNSSNPEITLDATRGALTVRDNATPLGANLFEVQNNAGSTTYFAVTTSGATVTGATTSSGNINSSGGAIQTGGTSRIDNTGNLINIGTLTLSGSISGGTTYSGSGNINTTGGAIQTNSTSRIDNSGNLVNIGNITGTGAITIASTGAGNDIIINGADILDIQDATTFATTATFNGVATFNTDVDLTLADTENLSITSTVTGTSSVDLISGVLTNNTSSGTQRGAVIQNAAGSGTTEALLVLDNADTDTAVTAGLQITAAAGGVTTAIDLTDADIVDAVNVGANNIVGTTGNIDLTNFDVVGSSGNTTVGGTLGVTGTTTLTGDLAANGNTTIGNANTDTVTMTAVLQGASPLVFEGGTADANELTLSVASLTADRTITLPDETGTICLQSSTNCGFALSSGSSSYIQNQSASDQTADFRISGTGRANTSILTPLLDTATATTLNIGTGTATAVNIATNAAAHTIAIGTGGAAQTVSVGSTNTTSTTTVQGGTGSSAVLLTAGTNGSITTFVTGTGTVNLQSANGTYVKSTTDNAIAFQVQNASNQSLFNVDSTNEYIINNGTQSASLLENGGFESAATASFTSGWAFGAQTSIINSSSNAHSGNQVLTTAANSAVLDVETPKNIEVKAGDVIYIEGWVKTASANGTGGILAHFFDKDEGTVSYAAVGGDVIAAPGSTYTRISGTLTVPTNTTTMTVVASVRDDSTTGTWYFDDIVLRKVNSGGPVTVQTEVDQAGGFQVQNAGGESLLNLDTDDGELTINQSVVRILGIAHPTNVALSSSGTGGSLAAGTYYYGVTAVAPSGETDIVYSTPTSVTTTGSTSRNTLSWTDVSGETSYRVFRSIDGGSTWFVNSVAAGTTSINDNGSNFTWSTSAGSLLPLASNSSGGLLLQTGTWLFLDSGAGNGQAGLNYSSQDNEMYVANYNSGGGLTLDSDALTVRDTTGYHTNLSITNTGAATFSNRTNSVAGFQIQNAAASQALVVDTTATRSNLISNPDFETDASGATGKGIATVARSTAQKQYGNASLLVTNGAFSGQGARITGFTQTVAAGTYTFSFDLRLVSGTWLGTQVQVGYNAGSDTNVCTYTTTAEDALTTGFRRYSCTFTSGANLSSVYVAQTDATARSFYIDGLRLESGSASGPYQHSAVTTAGSALKTTGNLFIDNYQTNNCTGINFSDCGGLKFGYDLTGEGISSNRSVSSADNYNGLDFYTNNVKRFYLTNGGNAVFQNASATALFTVDTSASRLYVGPTAGATTGVTLVLGTKTNTGDPSGVNGAMYYNEAMQQYRCFTSISSTEADGAWAQCNVNPIDRGFVVEDDFFGGSTGTGNGTSGIGTQNWTLTSIGSGCTQLAYNISPFAPTADRPGTMVPRATNVTNSGCSIHLASQFGSSMSLAAGNVVKTAVAPGATIANLVYRVGMHNETSTTTAPTTGVWWEANTATNANWQYCYTNGTPTATCAASGVAVTASTFVTLEIRINSLGSGTSAVDFFINGTKSSVSSVTVNTTNAVSPAFTCYTTTTATRECGMDYYLVRGYSSAQR